MGNKLKDCNQTYNVHPKLNNIQAKLKWAMTYYTEVFPRSWKSLQFVNAIVELAKNYKQLKSARLHSR